MDLFIVALSGQAFIWAHFSNIRAISRASFLSSLSGRGYQQSQTSLSKVITLKPDGTNTMQRIKFKTWLTRATYPRLYLPITLIIFVVSLVRYNYLIAAEAEAACDRLGLC